MVKLYQRSLTQKGNICFLISWLCMFLFIHKGIPYDSFVIFGHYVTIFINSAYLFFCYDRMQTMTDIRPLVQIRLKRSVLWKQLSWISIANILLYVVLVFLIPLFWISVSDIEQYLTFIFMNILMFTCNEVLYAEQIMKNKHAFLVLVPVILNFSFHFGWILMIWG